ncbi:MAG: hypothetical protein NTV81_00480 [Candidatus Komeilibacteria bacterium]|nr:hypothetical protein [Candidatus Komeilibacteria bacterium]
MLKKLLPIIKSWLPLAFALTVICGLIYGTVQQNYRQNANDPQIQMVEDIIDALNTGLQPQNLNSPVQLDMAKTLSPFMIIYDATGTPIISSGYLNKQIPTLPAGVLDYAKVHGQHRLTWQPRPDVRVAAVIQPYQTQPSEQLKDGQAGFVLAAKSLRDVEKNESQTLCLALVGWAISLLGSLLIMILLNWQSIKPKPEIDLPEEPITL